MTGSFPRKPRIGVTPDISDIRSPETTYEIRCNYAEAIARHGGLPVILPYDANVAEYCGFLDGCLVTGGMFDIDPVHYGQSPRQVQRTKPDRTAFERRLIDESLERDLPILGICNGMQLLAVCLGGRLAQDIASDFDDALEHKPHGPADVKHHKITFVDMSSQIAPRSDAAHFVNSVHHQSVLPSPSYRVIALAEDGVVEAIEAVGQSFAVGVQWHPEYALGEIDDHVFSRFVLAAAAYSKTRRAADA